MYEKLEEEGSNFVDDHDITEVAPPKSKINVSHLLKNYFVSLIPPISRWLPLYDRNKLKGKINSKAFPVMFEGDLLSGFTVGVIQIPQAMAYGQLAGLPPIYGLYASIIAPITYSIFATSMQLSVGPVAVTALLTASGVKALSPEASSPEENIEAAIVLSLVSGMVLLLLGLFKIGFVVEFLSNTVLSGFVSATACIIVVSQLKDVLGLHFRGTDFLSDLTSVFRHIKEVNVYAIVGSFICLALLFGVKKIKKIPKWIPSELILMLLGILISWASHLDKIVNTVGHVPSGLPPAVVPQLTKFPILILILQSAIIGLISFVGSIALARTLALQHGDEVDSDLELVALGLTGFIGSFFSAIPVSGSFSRTAVNNEMGAKSPISGLVTSIIVLMTLLFLTPIFEYLPKFVLASIVIISVRNLFDYKLVIYLWKVKKSEFIILAATFLCTLFIGIDIGILISILISFAAVLFRTSRPDIVPLGRIPKTVLYRNVYRHPQSITYPGITIFRIEADLYFANISRFKKYVYNLIKADNSLNVIIVDSVSINYIDPICLNVLGSIIDDLSKKNISLVIVNAHAGIREALDKGGITKKLNISPKVHIHQAVTYFLQSNKRTDNDNQTSILIEGKKEIINVVPLRILVNPSVNQDADT